MMATESGRRKSSDIKKLKEQEEREREKERERNRRNESNNALHANQRNQSYPSYEERGKHNIDSATKKETKQTLKKKQSTN
mmetsp:Transcript_4357/g.6610  ORF Transcript_4357/g.6610 Transcript_4357/m.6610 type:complete len:81 (-) Transcript_4357:127-369(-)